MKEQHVALEIFLPVGRCLLTLLSKRSSVLVRPPVLAQDAEFRVWTGLTACG